MRSSTILLFILLASLLGGCGANRSCKNACDKLDVCNIAASGFQSCSDTCKGQDADCGQCVNERACSDILGGSCANACPNTTFTAK